MLGTVFVLGVVFIGDACNCPVIVSLGPYESLGIWKTTDADGNECVVEILIKVRSHCVPPGELPRLKVICTSGRSASVLVHDTDWRFSVGLVQPVPGGVDVFSSPFGLQRLQFRNRKGLLWME